MILESEEHAARRGANVLCEVAGGAYTSDAFHITAPDPSGRGQAAAINGALKPRAGIEAKDVDYVAAHATATPLGDIGETNTLKRVFGDHAKELAISANKSMLGHLLGAAGAVSGLACMLAIRDGIVPPTINLTDSRPEVRPGLHAERGPRDADDIAVVNGFGFGGQNASAVFRAISG